MCLIVFLTFMTFYNTVFILDDEDEVPVDLLKAFIVSLVFTGWARVFLIGLAHFWSPFMDCLYSTIPDDVSVVHSVNTEITDDLV